MRIRLEISTAAHGSILANARASVTDSDTLLLRAWMMARSSI
jgi:hypothetical protein